MITLVHTHSARCGARGPRVSLGQAELQAHKARYHEARSRLFKDNMMGRFVAQNEAEAKREAERAAAAAAAAPDSGSDDGDDDMPGLEDV